MSGKRYYTGVGSRNTPVRVLQQMTKIATVLRERGFILRSGGAGGADSSFENGAGQLKEIYIPWNGFYGRHVNRGTIIVPKLDFELASRFHPAWDRCSPGAKKIHARNCNQVLGLYPLKSPKSRFLICWTAYGLAQGGTGQAIRLAEKFYVPVYNLATMTEQEVLECF